MAQVRVTLNGTDRNPFMDLWGLTQNPFPQIAKYEWLPQMEALNKLAAEPIKDVAQIESVMHGLFSDEFIQLCKQQFIPGKEVSFTVRFDE
jgi:hypothetical protein